MKQIFRRCTMYWYDWKWDDSFFLRHAYSNIASCVMYIHTFFLFGGKKSRLNRVALILYIYINITLHLLLLDMMIFSAHFHSCLYTSKTGEIDVLSPTNADVGKKVPAWPRKSQRKTTKVHKFNQFNGKILYRLASRSQRWKVLHTQLLLILAGFRSPRQVECNYLIDT